MKKSSFLYKKGLVVLLLLFASVLNGCNAGALLGGDNVESNDTVWLDGGEVDGPTLTVKTNNDSYTFDIEIADTPEERSKGLMYRESMKDNHGMLFIFDEEQELNFWMKNTLIPLDMIFFDHDYKIVHIQHDARPCKTDPCEVFSSLKPAKYVLEVKGGTAERLGITPGNTASVDL